MRRGGGSVLAMLAIVLAGALLSDLAAGQPETAPQPATPQPSTTGPATPQPDTPQAASPQETAPQETAPQETNQDAPQGTPQETQQETPQGTPQETPNNPAVTEQPPGQQEATPQQPGQPSGETHLAEAGQPTQQGIQEVVVTSQRREQNIQSVPIAVTAFTNEALQQRGLTDVRSLGMLTPGVNLDAGAPFSGDSSVLSASIRGIGQDDFAFNLNPGVGVYLDGVFLARTIGANQNLLDVERVEILKGPQGTLFGANTIGGAISIVTHEPGNEPRFIAQATGGRFDRRDVSFTADIPIVSDTLLSSITVASLNRNGWANVIPYPTSSPQGMTPFVVDPQTAYPKSGYATNDNMGGQGLTSMRGKLVWHANQDLSFTLTGDWSHQNQTALPYTVLETFSGNVNFSTFSTLYNLCIGNNASTFPAAVLAAGQNSPLSQLLASGNVCTSPRAHVPGLSIGGAPLLGAGYVGGPPGPFNINNHPGTAYLGTSSPRIYFDFPATDTGDIDTSFATGPNFARYDAFGFSLTGLLKLTQDLQLKSITGYRQIKWQIGTDLDGTPETVQEVTDQQHQWQVSQEFQLLGSAFDGNLNYVAGLYYFNESGYVHDFVPFESILYIYDFANNVDNKDYAIFFHGDYRLGDHWGFTAGGRFTRVETHFLGGQGDLAGFPCPVLPCTPVRYFPNIPDSQDWNVFDPTLGVQYHFNHDVMAYASWGKGFKQGGWTTRLSAVIPSPLDARFSPEYSKTYEVGLKSQWFDHHLQANAAVYYTDYTGIQLNVQTGISPVLENAGNAVIRGAELELQGLIGRGLTLNFSGAFIDAFYTFVNPAAGIPQVIDPTGVVHCPIEPLPAGVNPPCAVNLPGVSPLDAKLPKTPKWKLAFFPQYDYTLPNEGTARVIFAYTYTSSMYNDSLNTPALFRGATQNVDASIHYISPDGHYDVAVGGTNLTDDRYVTAGSPNNGAGEVGGYFNPPRQWYISVLARFGQ